MKRLNIPLLLVLIIGSLVMAVGTHLLHGYQVTRNAHKLLERAQAAEAEGDIEEQVRILRRYLRHVPEDTEQLKVLLRANKDQALSVDNVNVRELMVQFNSLEKAIRNNPNDVELRRLACEFAMHQYVQRFQDALSHLAEIERQNALTSSDRVLQARCLELTSKQSRAIKLLSDMIGYDALNNTFKDDGSVPEEDKQEISAYMSLLFMLKRQSQVDIDMDVANMLMNRMIDVNGTTDAYLNRASFYQSFYEGNEGKEKSLADIRKAMELDGQGDEPSPRVLLAAATTLMALGEDNYAETQRLLDEGLKKFPDDARIYSSLADLAIRKNEPDALKNALSYVEQGLSRLNMNPELLYQRANIELELGRIDDSRGTIELLKKEGYSQPRLILAQARLLMADGKYDQARLQLEKLRPIMRNSRSMSRQIDRNLMTCYKRLGMNDMILQFSEGLEDNANAMFDTAQSMAMQGRYDESLEILQQLQEDPKSLSDNGRLLVFKLALDVNVLKQQQYPESQRDWSAVDAMAENWLKSRSLRPEEAEDFRIGLLIKKGQTEEALQRAGRARLNYPNYASFWLYLNALATDYDQGMKILDQVTQKFGDSWNVRAARANRIVEARREDAMAELAKLSEGIEQLSKTDQTRLRSVLANSYALLNEHDKSIEILRTMLAEDSTSLPIRNSIFDMAFKSGNLEVMQEMLSTLPRDSTEWQVAQARKLLWEFDNKQKDKSVLREVKNLTEKVREKRPEWATIYVLQADVSVREGNPAGAETFLRTALEKRPGDVQITKQLANIYTSLNRIEEAEALMNKLPDSKKLRSDRLKEIRIVAAQDPAEALARAEELITADSATGVELTFLAELQMLNRKNDNALATFRQVIDLDKTQTSPWMRYVQLSINLGKRGEAEDAIRELQLNVPPERLPLLLGQCYTMLSSFAEAEATYMDGLNAQPNDPVIMRNLALLYQVSRQDKKHKALLQTMMNLQGDAEADSAAAWARRETAKQAASSMGYEDFIAALKLIEKNADASGNLSGEDLNLWLTMCAHRPEAPSRQMAVDRLNQIRDQRELTNGEQAILAYVYKTSDRWNDAERIMVAILTNDPRNALYLNTYISWLLERDDLATASTWLRKMPRESIEYVRFQTQILVRQNRAKEANRILLDITKNASADSIRTVAGIMEELGQYDPRFYKAAERQWTKYLEMKPNDVVGFVQFLTRVPKAARMEQALKRCEVEIAKAAKAGDSNAVSYYMNLGLKGLRRNRKSIPKESPLYARVARWFPVARKAGMPEVQVTWTEIDFHDIRGDFDRLEDMYRDFLRRSDPANPNLDFQKAVVRNNLAFQLAINNRGKEALEVIGDAISQLGPRSDFLDTRAMAHLASGDVQNAVKDLRTATLSGTATAAMFFHLALAEHTAGNQPQAVQALKRALEMDLKESDLTNPEIVLFRDLRKKLEPEIEKLGLSELELSAS